jgi:hypothetical protein
VHSGIKGEMNENRPDSSQSKTTNAFQPFPVRQENETACPVG